jgi:hypothetical protein
MSRFLSCSEPRVVAPTAATTRWFADSPTGAVKTVAVLATSNGIGRRAKVRVNQTVDAANRRHDSTSKWSAANVAYSSSCDGVLPPRLSDAARLKHRKPLSEISEISEIQIGPQMSAETAETALTSRTSIKWASELRDNLPRQPAQTRGNLPRLREGHAGSLARDARYAIALRSQVGVPGPELRNTRTPGKGSEASCG